VPGVPRACGDEPRLPVDGRGEQMGLCEAFADEATDAAHQAIAGEAAASRWESLVHRFGHPLPGFCRPQPPDGGQPRIKAGQ
jgi:hypothetical protein